MNKLSGAHEAHPTELSAGGGSCVTSALSAPSSQVATCGAPWLPLLKEPRNLAYLLWLAAPGGWQLSGLSGWSACDYRHGKVAGVVKLRSRPSVQTLSLY